MKLLVNQRNGFNYPIYNVIKLELENGFIYVKGQNRDTNETHDRIPVEQCKRITLVIDDKGK